MASMADVFPGTVLQWLRMVEERLQAQAESQNQTMRTWVKEPLASGGKRVRPMLLLTSYLAAGGDETHLDQALDAAVALELIHTASLVHDDLMDQAATRRGRPSTFAAHGVDGAILVGDYLFTQAFALGATLPPRALQETAIAVRKLCEGQLQEQEFQKQSNPTMDAYLDVIRGKTSSLLEAGCAIGAIIAQAPESYVQALRTYGDSLGNAFQVLDDVLDVAGNPRRTGKPVGTDFLEGTRSSPLLDYETQGLRLPEERSLRIFRGFRQELLRSGSIARSQLDAASHTQHGLLALESIPANEGTASLKKLAQMLMERSS